MHFCIRLEERLTAEQAEVIFAAGILYHHAPAVAHGPMKNQFLFRIGLRQSESRKA
jgi:hypothetical protein